MWTNPPSFCELVHIYQRNPQRKLYFLFSVYDNGKISKTYETILIMTRNHRDVSNCFLLSIQTFSTITLGWKKKIFQKTKIKTLRKLVDRIDCGVFSEAVVRSCSANKVFLEISQNSRENTCDRDSFLIKLPTFGRQLY